MARSPTEYAIGLISYLQQPEYGLLHGQYVSARAPEGKFYPEFLQATGWMPMPWRTVAIALGKQAKIGRLTRKRDREYRCARGGDWKRRSIKQFLIPRVKAKPARAAYPS